MPRKVTTYEFDIDKANSDPNAAPEDLIKKVNALPGDNDLNAIIPSATSLRPQDLYALITKINNTETEAIKFYK